MGQQIRVFHRKDVWYIIRVFDIVSQPLECVKWWNGFPIARHQSIKKYNLHIVDSMCFCLLSVYLNGHFRLLNDFIFRHNRLSVIECRQQAIIDGKPRVMMLQTRNSTKNLRVDTFHAFHLHKLHPPQKQLEMTK